MIKISNKPNIRGLKNTSNKMDYSAKLIGREGKLFAGLITTRVKGFAIGIILAVILVVIIPFIAKLCGL